jgi:hypothetical protein
MKARLLRMANRILRPLGYTLLEARPGYHYVPDIYGHKSFKMRDIREDRDFAALASRVVESGTTLLYYPRLHTLYQALRCVTAQAKGGLVRIAEVGVYRGGGSYFMASALQALHSGGKEAFCIDTFTGHAETDLPEGREGRKHVPHFFGDVSADSVRRYLSEFPFVQVKQARIQECEELLGARSFSMVHLDVDIYPPTAFSLRFFGERMVPGGIIVIDDYRLTTCPGIEKAVEEFWIAHSDRVARVEPLTGQCVLVFRERIV